jgi:glycosyltransferase involved in cell wall biosynthesis
MNDVNKVPKFSILIPTYKGADVIKETLLSIFSQSFTDYEIIVSEDCSGDNIEEVLKGYNDPRIKFFRTEKNLGYPGNLEHTRQKATGEFLYLMGQDDILGKDALINTLKAFEMSDDIGAVTRPYFWFDSKIEIPVRAKKQLNPQKDEVVKMGDSLDRVIRMFSTLDQLSGLALRSSFVDIPFHPDVFPCHVYPFVSIFKRHPVVFLKDYNIAVRIGTSQTRHVSSIYEKSPMQTWADMFKNIFSEKDYADFREDMIKNFVAKNYVGLVQIRNYGKYCWVVREIEMLLRYRWENILSPAFWFFSLGTLVMPPSLLIPLVDWYKNRIYSSALTDIKFEYSFESNENK